MNIVLAHGILGFDQVKGIEYFNSVKKHLEKDGDVKVLTTKVSATGSIKARGEELRKQILEGFANGKLDKTCKTHIIAHSMGGLDSRYILSENYGDPEDENHMGKLITSLTTVGTPHMGSPIANWLYPLLDGQANSKLVDNLEDWVIEGLKFFGILTDGLQNLTTKAMDKFNTDYADNPGVKYFWTAGVGRKGVDREIKPTSWLFLPLHEHIVNQGKTQDEKESDGVVPLSSAKRDHWEQIGSLWNADHADEVGHDLDKYLTADGLFDAARAALGLGVNVPPPAGLLDRYDEIVKKIKEL